MSFLTRIDCPVGPAHYCGAPRFIRIAKDGFPLELIRGRTLSNLVRILLLTDHLECSLCYQERTGIKLQDVDKG